MFHINSFKKTIFQLLMWVVVMLAIMIPLLWVGIKYPAQMQNLASIISHNKFIFTALRWLLIATFFYAWPYFIRHWAKHHYWKPEKTIFWLKQRLKITFWLVIFELLICENLFLTFIHLLERH